MIINLQFFAGTGVYPVHNNIFKVSTAGRVLPAVYVLIKDLETFSLTVESKTEEWTPMDLQGWARQAVTGKKLTVAFKGKRNFGDVGNDFIAGTILATGHAVETKFQWTLPDGAILVMDCVIALKTPGGGDSTHIDGLEFDLLSDGLPTFTAAP